MLATPAIIVWHFYAVIFDPDVYPLNRAFLDGRVAEEVYREEHELDFERMKGAQAMETEPEMSRGFASRQRPLSLRWQGRPAREPRSMGQFGFALSQVILISFSTSLNSGSPVTSSAFLCFVSAAAKQSANDILFLDLK